MTSARSPRQAWDVGELCTPARKSQDLFERIYDPAHGRLEFNRNGPFWDAVALAHDQGLRGQGSKIAILDSGFDVSLKGLKEGVAAESQVTAETVVRRGYHGTLVALLVRDIAPEAELVLIEVAPGARLEAATVGEAIGRVAADGVDAINLSLEFPSDCPPRDRSVIDVDLLLSASPPRERFLEQVRAWLSITDPYEPGGCRRACPVCATLRKLPARTLVVAAAGNTVRQVCPACSTRVLGLGFELERMLTREGGHVLANTLPTNFVQNLLVEVAVPQPPELVGTSFAAPFGTGFGALVQDRVTLPHMASLPFAMTPLFTLLQKLDEGASTDPVAETLRDGFFAFAEAVPEAHRHWTVAKPAPCPTCSLFMTNWYLNLVALLIGMGRPDEAIRWGALAAALVPHSAEVAANLGTAFERTSLAWPDASPQRERFLEQASDQFRRALRLEPGNQTWSTRLAELSRLSAASPRGERRGRKK